MARALRSDDLRREIAPRLPPPRPRPRGGRRPTENRDGAHRHPVRAAHRIAVGDAAGRDGLRLGYDLLAKPARLAGGGRPGPPASGTAGTATRLDNSTRAAPAWTAHLSRPRKGDGHRSEPDGSRRAGDQAPPRRRCPWQAPGPGLHRGRSSRQRDEWLRPSMRSRRCVTAGAVAHAVVPTSFMPTRPTTPVPVARSAAPAESYRVSPDGGSRAARTSGVAAGSSSEPMLGSTASAACLPTANAAPTSTRPSQPSPQASSPSTRSSGSVRRS